MNKTARILIGTLIVFLIVAAGLFTGWFFSTHKIVPVESAQTPAENAPTQKAQKTETNFNTYDISPPSRATTTKGMDVVINPMGNTAFVLLSKEKAADIRTGQKILLYAEGSKPLETLGEVSAVKIGTDTLDGYVTVHMVLNGDEDVDISRAKRGKIITDRIPNSARLPLGALVEDSKGETYIWQAVRNREGTTTAYRKLAKVRARTDSFFILDETTSQGGDYILNPDDALQEGQIINTSRTVYSAPAQTEDSRIQGLMDTRRKQREARKAFEAAQSSEGAAGGSSACAPAPDSAQDFIDKIKSMSLPADGP